MLLRRLLTTSSRRAHHLPGACDPAQPSALALPSRLASPTARPSLPQSSARPMSSSPTAAAAPAASADTTAGHKQPAPTLASSKTADPPNSASTTAAGSSSTPPPNPTAQAPSTTTAEPPNSTTIPSSTSTNGPTSPPRPLLRRRVVSSFLTTGRPHTPSFRVSLFKRSPRVRTYPLRWAACSGSIEAADASPRAAALRELEEETGLRRADVGLVGEGRAFELHEEALGVVWEIWPFVWRLREAGVEEDDDAGGGTCGGVEGRGGGGDGEDEGRVHDPEEEERRLKQLIRLDWEHTEVRFVTLEEMKKMDTVTDLVKSLETVLDKVE